MTSAQKPIITSALWIGTLLAIISNVLFSALYMYGKWLTPLSGTDVFFVAHADDVAMSDDIFIS